MADFDPAAEALKKDEGGYADVPGDRGGRTKYGISQAQYPDVDIKGLTWDQAKAIYKRDWWDKFGYGKIKDQALANKVLSMAVVMGPGRAHRLLQAAINVVSAAMLQIDGFLGPVSYHVINECDAGMLLEAFKQQCVGRFEQIASADATQGKFLRGWVNRANA